MTKYSRERPHGEEIWSRFAYTLDFSVLARAGDIQEDLSDTDAYLAFFFGRYLMPDFPHASRPQVVGFSGI